MFAWYHASPATIPVNGSTLHILGVVMTRQSGAFYDEEFLRQGSPANTTFAESVSRVVTANTGVAIGATGVELSAGIPLQFGDLVTNITFVTSGTAAGTPTAGYVCLRDPSGALLAQSADFGSTARAANTAFTVALATPQLITVPGLYYVGISFTATTVPTLVGTTIGNAATSGDLGLSARVLARTHGSSVGATAPATTETPTTVATIPYFVAT